MSSFFETLKNMLPHVTEKAVATEYFTQAWQLEYENSAIYKKLVPLIKYNFLTGLFEQLALEQEKNCHQVDVEIASNQVPKPLQKPLDDLTAGVTEFHLRFKLINILLENNKMLSSIYLHLSFMDTIAQSSNYDRLLDEKEKHVRILQDLAIRLN